MGTINKKELSLLQHINVLYIDDEPSVLELITDNLKPYFKNLFTATNGEEALEKYTDKISNNFIQLIISDINMPNMNGIDLVKNVKQLNKKVNIILVSGVTESNYLINAINLGVSHFILKPIKITNLLEEAIQITKNHFNQIVIENQKKELENFINAIDKVAIITKTDLKGNITHVNDVFCKVSGYTKEELIGAPHNIVRHPDMLKSAFEDLWKTIKEDKTWSGKLKNKAKDGTAYFTQVYIFPHYNNISNKKIGYIGVRYLTTKEDLQTIEFKKKVIQNISSWKKKEQELHNQIEVYKEQVSDTTKDSYIELLKDKLDKEDLKNKKLLQKIDDLEDDVINAKNSRTKQFENLQLKMEKIYKDYLEFQKKYAISDQKILNLRKKNDEKSKKIVELNDIVTKQKEVIDDLRDVISHREEKIKDLKGE